MKQLLQGAAIYVPVLVLFFILTAGFWLTAADFPSESMCIFRHVLHLDCPGCGLSRAFLLIPRGYWQEALAFNAGSVPLYFFFAYLFVQQGSEHVIKRGLRYKIPQETLALWILAIVLILLGQWVYKTLAYFSEHSFLEYILSL
jgi:hypothetical protein